MTLDEVVKNAQAAVARKAEREKAEPGESFVAWVEVPPEVFAAVLDKAKDTPETKEIVRGWKNHRDKFPNVATTVYAEQFLAVAGKLPPAPAPAEV